MPSPIDEKTLKHIISYHVNPLYFFPFVLLLFPKNMMNN